MAETGFTGAPPPFELIQAWLCEYYHCLPSELAQEPADQAILFWKLNQTYVEYLNKRPKGLRNL